jgi:glyoxylase-like metal-dependent hydrolase (beta-lactamase superfamily II)/8-oxo-dGTP pyrophosphatase MutT (NUDIX family)
LSAPPGLYERVLAAAGGAAPEPKPARPSAAVVPWRRAQGADGELEVYWLERGREMPFMAGWHAFPGGGLDRADAGLPVAGEPRHPRPVTPTPPEADGVPPADLDLIEGLAACALRELFEETGLLVVHGEPPARLDDLRRDLLARRTSFAGILAQHRLALDTGRLVFAGRWRTPPFAPVRFDNRFFLLEHRAADGEPEVAPPESESGEWIAPAAALERLRRGREMTAPPIIHILRVLAEEAPEAATARLLDTAEANLGPLRRIELRPGILLFPLRAATLPPASHTNVMLVGHADAVLVDPGSPFPAENARLVAALDAARERLGRRPTEIWLTHHHPDHVGGVEELRRALGVPVAAHAATAERLADTGIAIDRLLAGDERVTLGGATPTRLRLHHTPGHARGHLAIELEDAGDLVGGDLVAGFGTVVIDPPEGDLDDYLASLAVMRGRGFRTLFPAHGAPVLDVDAKLTETLEHRHERERQVLAAWSRGLRTPAALVPEVYAEVPAAVRPLAERQALAHLERLHRRGAIDGPPPVER